MEKWLFYSYLLVIIVSITKMYKQTPSHKSVSPGTQSDGFWMNYPNNTVGF